MLKDPGTEGGGNHRPALLAAKHTGDFAKFKPYAPAMEALLGYWAGAARVDSATGLRRWYNQLESGEDNLVLSTCPSDRSPECWDAALHELVIASADLATFLFREHTALASFCTRWAAAAGFLSWNTLAGAWASQLGRQQDPFDLTV